MRGFIAFFKKEMLALVRSGRLVFLGILFVLFGVMNPAIAKLTPWLFEVLADSLAESGFIVTETDVTALQAWIQFFKNIPLALIVVLVMFAGTFSNEYSKGSLIIPISKGISKSTVSIAKLLTTELVWTVGYWLCYGITYAYSAYYWDNSIMHYLVESVAFTYVFGVFLIAVLMCFAAASDGIALPLLGLGAVYGISYLLGILADCEKYVPTKLTASAPLYTGAAEPNEYLPALFVTLLLTIVFSFGMTFLGKRKI